MPEALDGAAIVILNFLFFSIPLYSPVLSLIVRVFEESSHLNLIVV